MTTSGSGATPEEFKGLSKKDSGNIDTSAKTSSSRQEAGSGTRMRQAGRNRLADQLDENKKK